MRFVSFRRREFRRLKPPISREFSHKLHQKTLVKGDIMVKVRNHAGINHADLSKEAALLSSAQPKCIMRTAFFHAYSLKIFCRGVNVEKA